MAARAPGRNALLFIFITVMINMIGFGIIIPVMPQLIMDVTGGGLSHAARWGGILSLVFAAMQFIMLPVMGSLSDKFGRRPVILISLIAYSGDFLILALAPSILIMLIARLFSGAFAATFATANAYIADISPPEKRAANFGLMGAAFGLGFIIGPALGGMIGEQFGHRAPFFAVAALGFINFIYGYFFLPETNPPENRRAFSWKRANAFGAFREFSKHPAILPVAGVIFLLALAQFSFPAVWAYFAEARFGWTPRDIGLSLMAVGFSAAIVQGGLTRIVIPRIGEKRAAYLGVTIAMISYFGYGVVTEGWMVYALIAFGALGGFAAPALQGIMSRSVPANVQGELQGAIGAVNGLAMIIGPVMMTQIFSYFTAPDAPISLPGAPFLVASLLVVIAYIPLANAMTHILRPREESAV
ncbi:MAG: TCR/Tet family MFS transporter [Parvularculaceae bacterium]